MAFLAEKLYPFSDYGDLKASGWQGKGIPPVEEMQALCASGWIDNGCGFLYFRQAAKQAEPSYRCWLPDVGFLEFQGIMREDR